jgi:hypothetical protein
MGPAEIRAYVEDAANVPLNTDDYPYLEYFVPRDLFHTTADNVREFAAHRVDPVELVEQIPADAAARLAALSRDRLPRR